MDIIRSRRLGELVRQARLDKGLTQAEVAWKVGPDPETGKPLGETQVSRVEAGTKEVTSWLAQRLKEVLDLDGLDIVEATSGYDVDAIRRMIDLRERMQAEADARIDAGPVHAARQAARRSAKRRGRPDGPDRSTHSLFHLPHPHGHPVQPPAPAVRPLPRRESRPELAVAA